MWKSSNKAITSPLITFQKRRFGTELCFIWKTALLTLDLRNFALGFHFPQHKPRGCPLFWIYPLTQKISLMAQKRFLVINDIFVLIQHHN